MFSILLTRTGFQLSFRCAIPSPIAGLMCAHDPSGSGDLGDGSGRLLCTGLDGRAHGRSVAIFSYERGGITRVAPVDMGRICAFASHVYRLLATVGCRQLGAATLRDC